MLFSPKNTVPFVWVFFLSKMHMWNPMSPSHWSWLFEHHEGGLSWMNVCKLTWGTCDLKVVKRFPLWSLFGILKGSPNVLITCRISHDTKCSPHEPSMASWHQMSLLRPGVSKQHSPHPKSRMFDFGLPEVYNVYHEFVAQKCGPHLFEVSA